MSVTISRLVSSTGYNESYAINGNISRRAKKKKNSCFGDSRECVYMCICVLKHVSRGIIITSTEEQETNRTFMHVMYVCECKCVSFSSIIYKNRKPRVPSTGTRTYSLSFSLFLSVNTSVHSQSFFAFASLSLSLVGAA